MIFALGGAARGKDGGSYQGDFAIGLMGIIEVRVDLLGWNDETKIHQAAKEDLKVFEDICHVTEGYSAFGSGAALVFVEAGTNVGTLFGGKPIDFSLTSELMMVFPGENEKRKVKGLRTMLRLLGNWG